MAMFTTGWAYALTPGLRRWFKSGEDMFQGVHQEVLRVESSTRNYEEYASRVGFGMLQERILQGANYHLEDPLMGWVTRIKPKEYSLGYAVGLIMLEDNLYKSAFNLAEDLGDSSTYTREFHGMEFWNNAAATNQADGVPLLSVAHPLKGGGTFSNRPAAATAPSIGAYKAALANAATAVNQKNMYRPWVPEIVLGAALDEWTWRQILYEGKFPDSGIVRWNQAAGTDTSVSPTGAAAGDVTINRAIVAGSRNVRLVLSPFLAQGTWFLLGPKQRRQQMFLDRVKPGVRTDDNIQNDNVETRIRTRYEIGSADFYGVYGSVAGM